MLFKRVKSQIGEDQLERYKNLCEQASSLLKAHGKNIEPYLDSSFPRLKAHHDPARVIKVLEDWVQVHQEALSAGENLHEDKKILWRMLSRLGLRPTADLMEIIQKDETVQIYTSDHWLIYYNLTFFDFIDATVDEVATIVWTRDSKRQMSVTLEALRLAFLIKTRQLKRTFRAESLPKHEVEFTFSGKHQKIAIHVKYATPLFGDSGMAAYLITQDTQRLTPKW